MGAAIENLRNTAKNVIHIFFQVFIYKKTRTSPTVLLTKLFLFSALAWYSICFTTRPPMLHKKSCYVILWKKAYIMHSKFVFPKLSLRHKGSYYTNIKVGLVHHKGGFISKKFSIFPKHALSDKHDTTLPKVLSRNVRIFFFLFHLISINFLYRNYWYDIHIFLILCFIKQPPKSTDICGASHVN